MIVSEVTFSVLVMIVSEVTFNVLAGFHTEVGAPWDLPSHPTQNFMKLIIFTT